MHYIQLEPVYEKPLFPYTLFLQGIFMKPKKRQKLCYNCEGEIDLDVIVCPFCAADLREEKPEQQRSSYSAASSVKNLNTQQSLYPPHYAPKVTEEDSPAPKEILKELLEEEPAKEIEELSEEPKNLFGPIILLALGSQLILFGLMMLLFQDKGVLLLKWDARFWYLYLGASLPLLIFGYRSLSK